MWKNASHQQNYINLSQIYYRKSCLSKVENIRFPFKNVKKIIWLTVKVRRKYYALAAWEASFFFWLFIKTTVLSLAPSNPLSASQYCKTTNQMNQLKLADAIILTATFPLDRSTFWHCILKSSLPSNNMILTYEEQGVNVASTSLWCQRPAWPLITCH